ncbi:MAG: pitrilysin family protein [Acidobacteriota bacterium]
MSTDVLTRVEASLPTSPGLTVRTRRVIGAPVVALRAWLRGGARAEDKPGQALLTGRMLGEGTARRDFQRIAVDAESYGMALSAHGGFEVYGVALDALASDWELAVDWLAELIFESSFPEERFSFLRRQALAELESLEDQADVVTAWSFLEQLYSPHPLGRPQLGDAAALTALSREDCVDFHAAGRARGAIVTAAGEIDAPAVERRLRERFAALDARVIPGAPPTAPSDALPMRRRVRTRAADQAHLYMGHRTVERRHPDHAALEMLSVVLGSGAGLAGRIPARVREREGLAYTAVASVASGAGSDPGRLVVYVGTSPETVAQAERAAREELERLLTDGLTDLEVKEARSFLFGREPFRRETARQWAEMMAEAELFALPVDDPEWTILKYRDLDRAALESAARRHIDPAKLKVTLGMPGRSKKKPAEPVP